MSITNYDGLRVVLRPATPAGSYEFILENVGDAYLWDLKLDVYGILGPSSVGLDDTYMKPASPHKRTAEFACFAPGALACISHEHWGAIQGSKFVHSAA
jgi:hypothetical protein